MDLQYNTVQDLFTGYDSEIFNKFRHLLHAEKIMLNMMQPINRRSFSNPELCNDNNNIINNNFHQFRQFLIRKNFQQITNNENIASGPSELLPKLANNNCDNFNACDVETKPTPIPRKSRNKKLRNQNDRFLIDSIRDQESQQNQNDNYNDDSDHLSIKTSKSLPSEILNNNNRNVFIQKSFEQLAKLPSRLEIPTIKTPIKIKTSKNSFRSFLMINKIKTHKFLSLRGRNSNRKSVAELNDYHHHREPSGYRRPTRMPPPPPDVRFRPPAPLPEERIDDDDEKLSSIQKTTTNDTISELYHDSANIYEFDDDIYCSVEEDESIIKSNEEIGTSSTTCRNVYKKNNSRKNTNANSLSDNDDDDDEEEEDDDYYDDGLCIYEELSSGEGTIYEPYGQDDDDDGDDDDFIYDNVDVDNFDDEINNENNDEQDNKKCIKQMKKIEKVMKRFNLTGKEIPVNAGIVKESYKSRSKYDLLVNQGETILILRMENNPPGKWLAKNERSKIGYINLNNVYLETDAIKAAFETLN